MELDHALIAVSDLGQAAHELETRHGLKVLAGGHHPGQGTANRIVPLGEAYLELVAIVDKDEAAQNPFGRWVDRATPDPARLLGWAVRTESLDEVAQRLGLTVAPGSRATGDGRLLRWRLAGIEQAAAQPSLPFFIEWERGTPLPGRTPADHRLAGARITELHLDGNADRLAAWLGAHRVPLTVHPGAPALTGIVVAGEGHETVLDAARL